ncbi:hypothetical protein ACT6QH_08805 [Xanthobacter sp. TB0139]|uniref:hypothetical protein n=1 Tax=Xanthobacter sp. TB0139 TaxID=3459178 RepID=UPI00403A074C
MVDPSLPLNADVFTHVRVLIAIVMGLSLTRLLTGLSRFTQPSHKRRVCFVHIGWTLYLILCLINFWWFQIRLANITAWTFEHYAFIFFYAALFFFTCATLYPDKLDDIDKMDEYFLSRKTLFYGLIVAINLTDVIDTSIKGSQYIKYLGVSYLIHIAIISIPSLFIMRSTTRFYHMIFVSFAIVEQMLWIYFHYSSLA